MKSIVLIGKSTPALEFNLDQLPESISLETLRHTFKVNLPNLVHIALSLRKLNNEVHVISSFSDDLVGRKIYALLKNSGCHVYPLYQAKQDVFVQLTSEESTRLIESKTPVSFSFDQLPLESIKACDCGILFEKNDLLFDHLLEFAPQVSWICNGFLPAFRHAMRVGGILIGEDEGDQSVSLEKYLILDTPWIIYFQQNQISLLMENRILAVPTRRYQTTMFTKERSGITALWISEGFNETTVANFSMICRLYLKAEEAH